MTALRQFEIAAIRLMGKNALSDEQIRSLCEVTQLDSYEYTGCGYFVTVKHPLLPAESCTLYEPAVAGSVGEIQAGFVVYLGDSALTLECHTWGSIDVPKNFRDCNVVIGVIETIGD